MIDQIRHTYSHPVTIIYTIVVFFAVIWHQFVPAELIDTSEYIKTAASWFSNVTISDSPLSEMRRSPMYPALSLLQFPFTHSAGIQSLRLIQLIASLLIPVVIFQILQILNAEKQFIWALFVLISFPLQFYYTALELPDILAQLLLVILFKQLIQKNSTGISVAILIGLKPIFFYLLALPLIQFFLKHDRNWLKVIFPFLFFGGWIFHNKYNHQLATYTSMGTTNAYYYNRKLLLNNLMDVDKVDSIYSAESLLIDKNKFKNRWIDSFMNAKTQESIFNYPLNYSFIHLKGSLQTLLDPGRYDAMVFWNWPKSSGFLGVNDGNPQKQKRPLYEWIYMAVFFFLGAIKLIMLLGILFLSLKNKSSDFASKIILATFAFYLLLLGPVGASRYLLPWYAIISIFIGINIKHLFKRHENITA